MNVLILTPDRTGSTLLQRVLTVYMQINNFDRPVINLHELTNGLAKCYSTDFNQEIVYKDFQAPYQKLSEITDLLKSVTHYKTCRLAQYHIIRREESISNQIPFYEFLNENFYIIATSRENLFEHALSWGVQNFTKQLNAYGFDQKFNLFNELYKNKIFINKVILKSYLEKYKFYNTWVYDNFSVQSIYNYDEHVKDLESYILNLNIFNNIKNKMTWKDAFDIEFNDFNSIHYQLSEIPLLLNSSINENKNQINENLSKLTVYKTQSNDTTLTSTNPFVNKYHFVNAKITELCNMKVLPTPIPIKLQTIMNKKNMIKNFDELLDFYNDWVDKNNFGKNITVNDITNQIQQEIKNYNINLLLE